MKIHVKSCVKCPGNGRGIGGILCRFDSEVVTVRTGFPTDCPLSSGRVVIVSDHTPDEESELVSSLPKCDECGRVATREDCNLILWCDRCQPGMNGPGTGPCDEEPIEDLPWAKHVRRIAVSLV